MKSLPVYKLSVGNWASHCIDYGSDRDLKFMFSAYTSEFLPREQQPGLYIDQFIDKYIYSK